MQRTPERPEESGRREEQTRRKGRKRDGADRCRGALYYEQKILWGKNGGEGPTDDAEELRRPGGIKKKNVFIWILKVYFFPTEHPIFAAVDDTTL